MPSPHASSTLDSANPQPHALNDRLNQRLLAYVAAAGAAGVSALVLAQPADAKVVYTPANRNINADSRLDLNNDGIPDYAFHSNFNICGTCGYFEVQGLKFNKFLSNAQPLPAGVSVGPDGKFEGGGEIMIDWCSCSGNPSTGGPWLGIQNEYMGFEFNIKGAAHFGWARFSVTTKGAITLTGYAYETIPNKTIIEGQTKGAAVGQMQSKSLGALATGAK